MHRFSPGLFGVQCPEPFYNLDISTGILPEFVLKDQLLDSLTSINCDSCWFEVLSELCCRCRLAQQAESKKALDFACLYQYTVINLAGILAGEYSEYIIMKLDPIFPKNQTPTDLKPEWVDLGFKFGEKGAHTSRTIMLAELSGLLHQCPATASRPDYVRALIEDNCLGKHTLSTRKLTLQRLSELYALDPDVTLFRLMRVLWDSDEKARPLLALLAGLARDPLLRATAPVIIAMNEGEEIARQKMTEALRDAVEGRLNESILDKVVRNTASSWTQSGHLEGRSRKRRLKVKPTPASTTFALILGYMLGLRGKSLFDTLFARVLDSDENELTFLAMDAKRLGLLDIKSSGGMTVVSFDTLLKDQERRRIHGTN